jgi:hypothetical protein
MKFEPMKGVEGDEDFFRLMTPWFTPREWEAIRAGWTPIAEGSEPLCSSSFVTDRVITISPALQSFLWHWVVKEAVIKALGVGMGMDLQTLEVTGAREPATVRVSMPGGGVKEMQRVDAVLEGERLSGQGWDICVGLLDERHPMCLAIKPFEGDPCRLSCIELSSKGLSDWVT